MSSNDSSSVVMQGLKDFQRRTVDHVFSRMFDAHAPSRRFLVADEVGLGKTLVAKGLIARTIAHLQSIGSKRVDVIYVCSNADIALQNVDRLMQPGQPAFCGATRLTLLPLMTGSLSEHPVNFISFTPGTTFSQTNRTGRKEERQLIYQMLRYVPGIDQRGLRNAMKGAAGDSWDQFAERTLEFDLDIARAYCDRVADNANLMADICAVTSVYRDRRRHPTAEDEERCVAMTGRLRRTLAKTCLSALEPDLVILDEFQRFGELFDDPETNPAAELAHETDVQGCMKVLETQSAKQADFLLNVNKPTAHEKAEASLKVKEFNDKLKDSKKAAAKSLKQFQAVIEIEARKTLRKLARYPVFMYEAEHVGLTATGAQDDNELFPNPRVPKGIESTALEQFQAFLEDAKPFLAKAYIDEVSA